MKTLTALFATAALALTANIAVAKDLQLDEVNKLIQGNQILPLEKLKEAALAKHPGSTVTDTEVEDVYGRYVYKAELRDAQSVEWDVDIDAKTGEVLKDEKDL